MYSCLKGWLEEQKEPHWSVIFNMTSCNQNTVEAKVRAWSMIKEARDEGKSKEIHSYREFVYVMRSWPLSFPFEHVWTSGAVALDNLSLCHLTGPP